MIGIKRFPLLVCALAFLPTGPGAWADDGAEHAATDATHVSISQESRL